MELNFTVTNQRIKYVSNLYIVEKSRNYLTAKFSFSGSEWKNVAKTAIFKKDDSVINVLLDENGRCTVPWELITRGTLKVSVFGGDLVTVDTAEVKILKSGYEEGNAPSEPTSDVYAQILAELQSIRDDFITEEMLGQAVEDWLAENVVEALSPDDVEKIVYDYLDEHKDELKGEKGAVFTPHVSDEGIMSWTNDGGLENPPPVDLKINVGSEYALVTEAGYSIVASIDEYYVLTVVLKNKAGDVLSTSEPIDLPIESMIVNVGYDEESGILTFSLQNGQTLSVNISTLIRGLVPTSRTIAGVDLEDDITADELKTALGVFDSTVTAGELKPYLHLSEEVKVGVYKGKPLYEKIIDFGNLPLDSAKQIEHGIENVETIWIHDGYCLNGNNGLTIPIVGTTPSSVEANFYFAISPTIINCETGTDRTHYTAYLIVRYTKTTDLEGSGNNLNPYGIYDAKLDDVQSSIASVSDEVDAVEEQLRKTNNLFDGNYKFITLDRSSEDFNDSNVQSALQSVLDAYGAKYYFVHILFPNGAVFDYIGSANNRIHAIFDEIGYGVSKSRRFRIAGGVWSVLTLGLQSDIDALNSSITIKDYTVSLVTNTTVAPFATFSAVTLADDASLYGNVISCIPVVSASGDICIANVQSEQKYVYVYGMRETNVTLRVTYKKSS